MYAATPPPAITKIATANKAKRTRGLMVTQGREFLQAGIESFGRTDIAAADAEMLALGLEACAQYGLGEPEIRIGTSLMEVLEIPVGDWLHQACARSRRRPGRPTGRSSFTVNVGT